jgi:ATP-dependent Lhr-like helicase
MDPFAADELIGFFKLQRQITQTDLPHRHHLLIEHFDDPLNKADSKQVILHTLWGGRINRPFAMALSAAWEKQYHTALETFADDDCIVLLLPHAFDVNAILDPVDADNVEHLLRECLEKTGVLRCAVP